MKINIQLFGGRGASSNKTSSYTTLMNKSSNMKYFVDINRGIDISEKNKNLTSITSYKISELEKALSNVDETIVQVQQGSSSKRIEQLKNIGFNVISQSKGEANTSPVLIHIRRKR